MNPAENTPPLAVAEFKGILIVSPSDYSKTINKHMTVPTNPAYRR